MGQLPSKCQAAKQMLRGALESMCVVKVEFRQEV